MIRQWTKSPQQSSVSKLLMKLLDEFKSLSLSLSILFSHVSYNSTIILPHGKKNLTSSFKFLLFMRKSFISAKFFPSIKISQRIHQTLLLRNYKNHPFIAIRSEKKIGKFGARRKHIYIDDLRACRNSTCATMNLRKGPVEVARIPSRVNLIGSWILSSARNYYLRYKSGDLPRQPSRARRYYPRSHTRTNQPPRHTRSPTKRSGRDKRTET